MRPSVPTGFWTGSRPNTCTDPACALSMPRMCLIRVVLPAPLPPIRPKTPPRGTASETSLSALLLPNCRVSRRISMMGGAELGNGSFMRSFLVAGGLHSLVALLSELDELVEVNVHLSRLGQQGVDALGENLDAFAAGQGRALVGNVGTSRAAFFDQPDCFELAIGAGHGVGINDQPFGQDANGGQFFLRFEPARGDQVFDLVDDLQVDRHAVIGGDVDLHGTRSADKRTLVARV